MLGLNAPRVPCVVIMGNQNEEGGANPHLSLLLYKM